MAASNPLTYKGTNVKAEELHIFISGGEITVEPSPDKEQLKHLLEAAGLTVEKIEEIPCG